MTKLNIKIKIYFILTILFSFKILFANSPAWVEDFETAKSIAKKEKKPIFVMMTANWCGPCKALESKTLPHKDVANVLKNFVCVKVYEDNKLERELGCNGYPTLVFMSHDQNRSYKFSGYKRVGDFMSKLTEALRELRLEWMLPNSINVKLSKTVEIDDKKAQELALRGDFKGLISYLRPIGESPSPTHKYFLAKVNLPEKKPDVLDVFWGYSYKKVPSSGLILCKLKHNSSFFIKAKGFSQILDSIDFKTSNFLYKEYTLTPLLKEDSVSINISVTLPDGKPAENAFVRLYDWETVQTDSNGKAILDNVSPGEYTIRGEYPGCEETQKISITKKKQQSLSLKLKPSHTIRFRWVYQPISGSTDLKEGVLKGEAIVGLKMSRFSLRQEHPLNNYGSDFMFYMIEGKINYHLFDMGGTHEKRNGLRFRAEPFDLIEACSSDLPYEFVRNKQISPGNVFVTRSCEDEHYAKVEILSVDLPYK